MTVKEAVKKMIEEFEALAGIELFIANDLDEAIDNVIAAARLEGAEAERERIVRGSERFPKGSSVEASEYIDVEYGPRVDDTIALAEIFVTPASLLVPKEEGYDRP